MSRGTEEEDKLLGLSEFEKEREAQKIVIKRSLKHLFVRIFILFILAAFGAFIFRYAEGVKEVEYKCGVKKVRRDFLDNLWSGSRFMKEEDWKSLARRRLLKFEDELHTAFEAGINSYSGQKAWSFLNSFFYALTVMTTIGYGHISPVTTMGQIFTILYAIIGIPLFSIVMIDAGKLLTRAVKLWLTRKKENQRMMQLDDEFNFPLKLAFIILLVYSILGTLFFYIVEREWGLLGSFYFIFISTSTIGFGDLVPESPLVAIFTSVYFLFGLALTSLCIGLVQEQLDVHMTNWTEFVASVVGISVTEQIDQSQSESLNETETSFTPEEEIKEKEREDPTIIYKPEEKEKIIEPLNEEKREEKIIDNSEMFIKENLEKEYFSSNLKDSDFEDEKDPIDLEEEMLEQEEYEEDEEEEPEELDSISDGHLKKE